MNLVMNSRAAMPGGGRICIEAANLDTGHGLPSGSAGERKVVSLTVTDTGSGMTPRGRPARLRTVLHHQRTGQGTGLAWPPFTGVVKEADGDIRLASQPGSGTTITVLLPAADRDIITRAPVTRPAAAGGAGQVILVVEDEDAVRDVVTRILDKSQLPGHAGRQREGRAGDHHQLRGSHRRHADRRGHARHVGPQLADRMRAARPQVPILLMSGYTAGALPGQSASGDLPLIRKPFNASTLLQYLQDALT